MVRSLLVVVAVLVALDSCDDRDDRGSLATAVDPANPTARVVREQRANRQANRHRNRFARRRRHAPMHCELCATYGARRTRRTTAAKCLESRRSTPGAPSCDADHKCDIYGILNNCISRIAQ